MAILSLFIVEDEEAQDEEEEMLLLETFVAAVSIRSVFQLNLGNGSWRVVEARSSFVRSRDFWCAAISFKQEKNCWRVR